MKNLLLFIFFLFTSSAFAQCPVGVQITASEPNPVCKNTPVTLTASATNGGATPTFLWVLNGDTASSDSTFITAVDFANVEVILISSNNCAQDTANAYYSVTSTYMTTDYNVIVTECNQSTADVEILGIIGHPDNGPYSYELFTAAGSQGQQDVYSDLSTGTAYPFHITDASGCVDTNWINTSVLQCPPPSPTEIITPNDDGFNDVWQINNISYYPENEVFIFDRWGQRVYHKKGYDNLDGWGAKYVGVDLPVSTYYYILNITQEKSDDLVFKGAISVFR